MVLRIMRFPRHDCVTVLVPRRPAAATSDVHANGTRPLAMRWVTVADSRGEVRLEARWDDEAGEGSQERPTDVPCSSLALSAA
jgi:hypothetical protein